MSFVKGAWRILVGIKDALVLLLLLLFFGALYTALSFTPAPPRVGNGALVLKLNGVIAEQPAEVDAFSQLAGQSAGVREFRLRDVVNAIEIASGDDKVKAIVLDLDGFMGGGQVALSRVGAALDKTRAAKKPVLAYATAYGDDGYQLAAHASEIWVNSFGGVMLSGPGGSRLYYKGLIDKLGVNAHVYRVGTYKSFVEPYIRADQSPEAKAADQALAGALWANWQAEVAKARPKAKLATYINDPVAAVMAQNGDVSKAALAAGIVDHADSDIAFGARVAQLAGADPKGLPGGYARISLASYIAAHPAKDGGDIGVITIAGDIVDGKAGPGTAGGDSIAALIGKAVGEGKIKALVVRVDSPGGSVLASERIRNAILAAKGKGLPIVVSMGNVAASGGYWVSTTGQTIFAEPATITGSIGVFGILPSFENTLAKAGITTDGIKTTPLSGEPNILGGTSPQFDALAQAGVEDIYRRFVGLVGQSRRMPVAQVDTIAQGRVWDGGTARQLKLVDRFGGIEDAIAEAAKLAKLDPASAGPRYLEKEPDAWTRLIGGLTKKDDEEGSDADAVIASGAPASSGDWLSQQAWLRRHLAVQMVADLRTLLGGGAIHADCLECRAMMPVRPVPAPDAEERGFWSAMGTLVGAVWR